MSKVFIGQDGLYLDGKLCCTLPPSGAENTGLSSDTWPLAVKIHVFGMTRYIALSNTGHYEMCLDLYDVKKIMTKTYEEWLEIKRGKRNSRAKKAKAQGGE